MTDYLGQLVLRARQPDVAVQPRLLSWFETPRMATFDTLDISTSGETAAPRPRSSSVMALEGGADASAQQTDREHRREPESAASTLAARSARSVPTPHSGELMEPPSMVAQRIRREPARSPVREVDHPTAHTRPEPAVPRARGVDRPADTVRRPSPTAQPLVSPVEPIHRVVQEGETQARPRVSTTEPAGKPTDSTGRRDRDLRPEILRSDRQVDLRPQPDLAPARGKALFQPLVSPLVTRPDVDRAQVSDAPVIQVTIGRVEIRATVAPTPVRKPPVRSPALSLDEYLKKRSGASRE